MSKKPSLTIEVKVKPKSKTSSFVKLSEVTYYAQIHSIAEKNKANLELLQLVAGYFKVNQSQVKILKGLSSKNKLIGIYE